MTGYVHTHYSFPLSSCHPPQLHGSYQSERNTNRQIESNMVVEDRREVEGRGGGRGGTTHCLLSQLEGGVARERGRVSWGICMCVGVGEEEKLGERRIESEQERQYSPQYRFPVI